MLEKLLEESFFEELEEILKEGQFMEPNAPTRQQDIVVDQMSEIEKAFYTLSNKKAKLAGMSILRLQYENLNDTDKNRLSAAANALKTQADVLRDLMWILIKDRLNLWGKSIGIRDGFRVVWFEDDPGSMKGLRDLLGLLGQPPE